MFSPLGKLKLNWEYSEKNKFRNKTINLFKEIM